MEIRKIRLIIILVAVSLTGLIIIQGFWAYNSYKLHEKNFHSRVMDAMHATVKVMNDNLDCFELFSKVHINPREGFYMVRQRVDGEKFVPGAEAIDTVPMYFANANKNFPFDYSNLMFGHAVNLEMVLRFRYLMNDSAAKDNSVNRRQEITIQNFREKFSEKTPVFILFDTLLMDSILKQQLKLSSIDEPFHFAYSNREKNNIEFASSGAIPARFAKSNFRVELSSDHYFSAPYEFIVYFQNYNQVIFSGIKGALFLSVFIILTLLVSFYVFIKIILRQRRLSELKHDFINNLTHEFKTPLSNISVALETLSMHSGQPAVTGPEILRIIGQETERLRDNVEKILQIARFEKEKVHLTCEKLDVNEVIRKAVAGFGSLVNSNGVSVQYDFRTENPVLLADETHFINIISNLVDNSIKYSNHHCRIDIRTENRQEGVLITFRDNGIGLSKDGQKRIFEKFYREPNGDLHNVKGFGLGLTYVKLIVDAHLGQVTVSSAPGKGTAFEIYFPNGYVAN